MREDGELALLCVPDAAIAEVAAGVDPGPWVAHVSGATPLSALEPHERRFCCTRCRRSRARGARAARRRLGGGHGRDERGPGPRVRARGAARPAAVRAGRRRAAALPRGRGGRLELPRHAAPGRVARSSTAAGAPPEALEPLMRRTIENGFELTGPIERGDWETVEAHREAIRGVRPISSRSTTCSRRRPRDEDRPQSRPARSAPTTRSGSSRRWARSTRATSRSSAPPAPRTTSSSSACSSTRRSSRPARTSTATRATRSATPSSPRPRASTSSSCRRAEEIYPDGFQTWVEVEELGSMLEGEHRPGHFRGVATVCLKLFNLVRPPSPTSARRTRSRRP